MSTRSLVSVNPGIERSALKHDLDPREFFHLDRCRRNVTVL